jgi:hypothetical protein
LVAVTCGAALAAAPVSQFGDAGLDGGAALELADGIEEAIARFNEHAHYPIPELSLAQRKHLSRGELVRLRERPAAPGQPQRALGFLVVDLPKELLWLAGRDPHFSEIPAVHEVRLSRRMDRPERWYQYVELPWPLKDRHWVIDIWDQHSMDRATAGSCWEHWWSLSPNGPALAQIAIEAGSADGVTPDMAADAVYVPHNTGAYLFMDLPGGRTLTGYHASTVLGGHIPDSLVVRHSKSMIDDLLLKQRSFAHQVPLHYGPGHEPFLGGGGEIIEPGSLSIAHPPSPPLEH